MPLKTQKVLLLISAASVLVVVRREGAGDAAGLVRIIDRRLVRAVVLGAVVHGDLGVCAGTQHVWDAQTRTAMTTNNLVKCGATRHANATALSWRSSACMGGEHRAYSPLLLLFSEKIKRASFSHVRMVFKSIFD